MNADKIYKFKTQNSELKDIQPNGEGKPRFFERSIYNPANLRRSASHSQKEQKMIHVLATIELKPEKRGDFLKRVYQLVPKVKAEKGCLEYGPAVDAAGDQGPNISG